MGRLALLIRTHYADDEVKAFIETLREPDAYDLYVLADEARGALDFGDVPKIALGPGIAAELGLYAQTPNLMWRCGDYGLYAARRALPEYDGFWLIEPDVRICSAAPGKLLARFPAPSEADFLAARLAPADKDWNWARTMDAAEGPIWRCLYSLVRLSARAVDVLFEARRRASAVFLDQGTDPNLWPNDEVFTASTLARAGLRCHDLNAFGEVYEPGGFSFWAPFTDKWVAQAGRDGHVYHPVLSGQRYFMKLFRLANEIGRLEVLDGLIDNLIGEEWTAEEAAGHHRAIALAMSLKNHGT
jgi:hypothetical protein